jgi:hypothetical protein
VSFGACSARIVGFKRLGLGRAQQLPVPEPQ